VKQREDGIDRAPRPREDQSSLKYGTSSVTQEDGTAAPAESDPEANLEDDYQRLQNREGGYDERLPEVRVESDEPDLRIDGEFRASVNDKMLCEETEADEQNQPHEQPPGQSETLGVAVPDEIPEASEQQHRYHIRLNC
jgi:hypothetical protein